MGDLIEALQILKEYGNPQSPTCCGHDILYVGIDPEDVSEDDTAKLNKLGFHAAEIGSECCFKSFRFGSY